MTDNFSVRRPRTIDERISESMTKREIDFIQKLKPEFLSGRFFNGNIGSSKTDGTPSGGGASSNPPVFGDGGSDGGSCSTLQVGTCIAMKLNASVPGLMTNDIIISVGVRSCQAGTNCRLKILNDGVNCAFVPFSFPTSVIAETNSFPLVVGQNNVNLSAVVPHDTYYSGSAGCGANHPDFGAVWIAVEVDANTDLGYYGVTPFFGYSYARVHTFGSGAPPFNYPSDIRTDAFNINVTYVRPIP